MRVVIAEDSVLLREGLVRLLVEADLTVVSAVGDAEALVAAVEQYQPDLAVIDIRMPPTFTVEGARAATELRRTHPATALLLLSQSLEGSYALELARTQPRGFGYLLKDRVLDVAVLVDAIERVAAGGTVLEPEVVAHLLGRHSTRSRLTRFSPRERDVLQLMAEGRSNRGLATALTLTERTVESHIASIFSKLDLPPEPEGHRRVLAVLAWLDGVGPAGANRS